MKIQVRQSVFETNSSSVHTLTFCSESDFNKWKEGELFGFARDLYYCKIQLVTPEEKEEMLKTVNNISEYNFYTYDSWSRGILETFEESYVSESGDNIVAFGIYGDDY